MCKRGGPRCCRAALRRGERARILEERPGWPPVPDNLSLPLRAGRTAAVSSARRLRPGGRAHRLDACHAADLPGQRFDQPPHAGGCARGFQPRAPAASGCTWPRPGHDTDPPGTLRFSAPRPSRERGGGEGEKNHAFTCDRYELRADGRGGHIPACRLSVTAAHAACRCRPSSFSSTRCSAPSSTSGMRPSLRTRPSTLSCAPSPPRPRLTSMRQRLAPWR